MKAPNPASNDFLDVDMTQYCRGIAILEFADRDMKFVVSWIYTSAV